MLVSKFVNCLMQDGKKSVALAVFYQAMDRIKEKFPDQDTLEVFNQAVQNIKPDLEVRSKRVGGAAYQVPIVVKSTRQQSLAIRWILGACWEKKGKPMAEKLGDELIAAYKKEGAAYTKRDNVHRMADANRAFAHFAS